MRQKTTRLAGSNLRAAHTDLVIAHNAKFVHADNWYAGFLLILQNMKTGTIIGLIILAIAWLVLVAYIFLNTAFSLKTLLIVIMSGIIIFVPLWKKYFRR